MSDYDVEQDLEGIQGAEDEREVDDIVQTYLEGEDAHSNQHKGLQYTFNIHKSCYNIVF